MCGVDRRCYMAVHWLMTSLAERGLARRLKRGTYLSRGVPRRRS